MAYVLQAWLPLIVWQQVDAPEYRKGFITVSCISLALIVTTFVIRSLDHKGRRSRGYVIGFNQSLFNKIPNGLYCLTSFSRALNIHGQEAGDSLSDSISVTPVDTQQPRKVWVVWLSVLECSVRHISIVSSFPQIFFRRRTTLTIVPNLYIRIRTETVKFCNLQIEQSHLCLPEPFKAIYVRAKPRGVKEIGVKGK
jgi:hypothetical protein